MASVQLVVSIDQTRLQKGVLELSIVWERPNNGFGTSGKGYTHVASPCTRLWMPLTIVASDSNQQTARTRAANRVSTAPPGRPTAPSTAATTAPSPARTRTVLILATGSADSPTLGNAVPFTTVVRTYCCCLLLDVLILWWESH